MNTECALCFGTSSISIFLLPVIPSPKQRVKLSPRGPTETVYSRNLARNKQFCTFKYLSAKNANANYCASKFYTTDEPSLTVKDQSEESRGQILAIHPIEADEHDTTTTSSGSALLSSSTSQSRSSPSYTGRDRELHLQSAAGHNLAHTSLPTLLQKHDERMRQLYALAALRQARILDSRVFRQTYVIRSYEVCANGTTSIDTLLSLFQDVALNHVSLLGIAGDGFGATLDMNRYRLIWVITRLHVEVERYPTWPETVEIDSWTDAAGKNGMRRDWLVRDHGTGEIIARATSTWAMINQDTRRLSKMPEDVRVEIEHTFVQRHALEELTVQRIPKLDNTATNIQSNLSPLTTDLDLNHHINNVTYVRWLRQSTPTNTLDTHELRSITLEFRRECNKDDIVESLTDVKHETEDLPHGIGDPSRLFINSTRSSPAKNPTEETREGSLLCTNNDASIQSRDLLDKNQGIHYIHLLRMQSKGEEIVRGRTFWKEKACWPKANKLRFT